MSDSRGPDSRRPDSRIPDPSLDAVRRSDDFIEALAAGRPVTPQDHADAALAALLGGWRDENRWPPATGLISEPQAAAALDTGLAEKRTSRREAVGPENWPTTKRSRRGLSAVGLSAAAVLCIGGFGALIAGAGPGDALYGLRTMLFPTTKQVRDDQVGLAARTELNQVQELISKGDWEHAQEKLVAVSSQVESIDDAGQKQELVEQFNDLSAKVVERDPNATAPPGITYTVPPSSTELVPTVAPTSVPAAPSATETSTPAESPAAESAASTPSEPPTSSESPAPETSPAAEANSVPTTTPTSAAPTTTASTATAPTASGTTATTATAPTTAVPSTAALSTTPAAPKSSSAPVTAQDAPSPTVTPTAVIPTTVTPTAASELPPLPQSNVTTTVVVPQPVPVGG